MPNSAPPPKATARYVQIVSAEKHQTNHLSSLLPLSTGMLRIDDSEQPASGRLVLVDCASIDWPEALDELKKVQQENAGSRVALLNLPPEQVVDEALRWPVLIGIFTNDMDESLIRKGLAEILNGGYWFARAHMRLLAQLRRPPKPEGLAAAANLSNRELDVLRLTAMGKSNVEIASELYLSHHTVKTHLYNLYRKLGVNNRTQAVHWYQQNL